ncbi:hypothetical protein HYH03_014704 [Edaphochlamys debaryana]|uniref:Uncharacterized protein n=1 Tax=Edaphochlamys debaryana TaxID=47281 RepID=A0A835XM74_9CHLO|nr:hypothetical protein HYH03_014704 [Edaphochlamys debaryana]|eukprot:KAG2486648.1 hypothetical protein HYH03_014704 [Edaphochlamys debaryana]
MPSGRGPEGLSAERPAGLHASEAAAGGRRQAVGTLGEPPSPPLAPPPPPECVPCSSLVESSLALGLCQYLNLANCSVIAVSCVDSAADPGAFPLQPPAAGPTAAAAGRCQSVMTAFFNLTDAGQVVDVPGFGPASPPTNAATDLAVSSLLKSRVANNGRGYVPGSVAPDDVGISAAVVADAVSRAFGVPSDQVNLVPVLPDGSPDVVIPPPNIDGPAFDNTTRPPPSPGLTPSPELSSTTPPPPAASPTSCSPKIGTLCNAAAVGVIVGIVVGGLVVIALIVSVMFLAVGQPYRNRASDPEPRTRAPRRRMLPYSWGGGGRMDDVMAVEGGPPQFDVLEGPYGDDGMQSRAYDPSAMMAFGVRPEVLMAQRGAGMIVESNRWRQANPNAPYMLPEGYAARVPPLRPSWPGGGALAGQDPGDGGGGGGFLTPLAAPGAVATPLAPGGAYVGPGQQSNALFAGPPGPSGPMGAPSVGISMAGGSAGGAGLGPGQAAGAGPPVGSATGASAGGGYQGGAEGSGDAAVSPTGAGSTATSPGGGPGAATASAAGAAGAASGDLQGGAAPAAAQDAGAGPSAPHKTAAELVVDAGGGGGSGLQANPTLRRPPPLPTRSASEASALQRRLAAGGDVDPFAAAAASGAAIYPSGPSAPPLPSRTFSHNAAWGALGASGAAGSSAAAATRLTAPRQVNPAWAAPVAARRAPFLPSFMRSASDASASAAAGPGYAFAPGGAAGPTHMGGRYVAAEQVGYGPQQAPHAARRYELGRVMPVMGPGGGYYVPGGGAGGAAAAMAPQAMAMGPRRPLGPTHQMPPTYALGLPYRMNPYGGGVPYGNPYGVAPAVQWQQQQPQPQQRYYEDQPYYPVQRYTTGGMTGWYGETPGGAGYDTMYSTQSLYGSMGGYGSPTGFDPRNQLDPRYQTRRGPGGGYGWG